MMFNAISSRYAGVTPYKKSKYIMLSFHIKLKIPIPDPFLAFLPQETLNKELCQNNFTRFSVYMLL